MKNKLAELLDWIYKKKCYFCGRSKERLKMCSSCYFDMEYLPAEPNRQVLGVNVYCAGVYESNLQKLIRGLKYHKQQELAYFQAKFMYDYWKLVMEDKSKYIVIPVPLHQAREKSRKYNHMQLVAEEFCKLSGNILGDDILKRVKNTKPQYKLNKTQRMNNLANAFEVKKSVNGKILLIDDICTTGSTFENIILELKKNNMNDIVCLATSTPFSGMKD